MGLPVEIFTSKPPDGCICAICHDVLKDAVSMKECGHSFCRDCATACLQTESCPTCRVRITSSVPSFVARELIGSMEIRCPNGSEEESSKRRRGNDGQAVAVEGDGTCHWKGECKDLQKHEEECEFTMVKCTMDGCNHECIRKDMTRHLSGDGLLRHLNLMKQTYDNKIDNMQKKLTAQHNKKVAEIKNQYVRVFELYRESSKKLEAMVSSKSVLYDVQIRYINDCRAWIEDHPDALNGVTIYQIKEHISGRSTGLITGLLCYIPGPEDSVWEGSRIPVTFRYNIAAHRHYLEHPPKCKVPAGFFHMNAYPSGTFYTSTLDEDGDWSSDMTFPEILFTVQAWLSHPNLCSPSNITPWNICESRGVKGYNERCQEEAKLYTNYTGHHPNALKMLDEDKERIDQEDIISKAEKQRRAPVTKTKLSPPELKTAWEYKCNMERMNYTCRCSCCAWGQTLWDEKGKMRYLFGCPRNLDL